MLCRKSVNFWEVAEVQFDHMNKVRSIFLIVTNENMFNDAACTLLMLRMYAVLRLHLCARKSDIIDEYADDRTHSDDKGAEGNEP